jgi:voltage-gated potassium channel
MRRRPLPQYREHLVLRRPERLTPWQSIGIRAGAVLLLIGIALAGHWFDRDGLRDNLDGHISFVDVVYFTMITVTTVGYGDIVPVTPSARLFDTLVVTPVRIFVWLIFLGTAYNFVIRRTWERYRTRMIERALSGHIIVCGFGNGGSATVAELLRKGCDPQSIVVVDPDEERVTTAIEACRVLALKGDASRDATLTAVGIERAASVIVSPGRDDTTALIVLTARKLGPKAHISASVRNEENEDIVRQAGADTVVNPVNFGGHLLAQSIAGGHAVEYLQDLSTAGGSVEIRERPVAADEVGHPLADIATGLGLRIVRGRTVHGFWEVAASRLQPDDIIVEAVPVRPTDSGSA